MKDQAIKKAGSRKRKVWVIKTASGEEYEAYTRERQGAAAIARQMGIKPDKIFQAKNERWKK